MKKISKMLICLLLICTILTPTYAAAGKPPIIIQYERYAEKLSEIGVFNGTGNGFELNREPTRIEGVVMLIRLLGAEEEALAMANESCVFTDVPNWAVGYANYAYTNGLTKGIGNNLFGSGDIMQANSYTTFMLRALGYDDSIGDFSWSKATEFAEEIDLIGFHFQNEITNFYFLRDQVAKMSYEALKFKMKNSNKTLAQRLVEEGAIPGNIANNIHIMNDEIMEVHFLGVGQADSILIIQDDEYMLVDAGNNADSDFVVDYLNDQGVDELDYVIGTHPHEDHIGGLDAVIDAFEVETVLMPDVEADTVTYSDVIDSINNKGLAITRPEYGDEYTLGDAKFTILAPNSDNYSDVNNYSIVILLEYRDTKTLLTGDAEVESEEEILAKEIDIDADLLKLGHHGSDSSTSQEFFDAVSPDYVVICYGEDNTYGHPSNETMQKLYDIPVYEANNWYGTQVAYSDGVGFDFLSGGTVTFTPTIVESDKSKIEISNLDKVEELVTLTNNSLADINMTGWYLISLKGEQTFYFPDNYIFEAGCTITIASGDAIGDLKWSNGNIWNNSDPDSAVLFDNNDEMIDLWFDE